jgi:hypothetical protein
MAFVFGDSSSRNDGDIGDDVNAKSIMNFKGLTIVIENPIGSIRQGVDKEGNAWQTKFFYPYGYIYNTKGKDNGGIDVFIGNSVTSDRVFIIHQTDGYIYDEDKVMLGFDNKEQARDAYLAHFQTQGYLGVITEMPMFEFKQKIKSNAGNKIA